MPATKQPQNGSEVLNLLAKLQEQINTLDKKLDLVMGRVMSTPAPLIAKTPQPQQQPAPREKMTFRIICADCGKESTLPFRPNPDRPVYCKECFALRRKGGTPASQSRPGSGPIKAEDGYSNMAPTLSPAPKSAPAAAKHKKPAAAKKPAATKKKAAAKKKK